MSNTPRPSSSNPLAGRKIGNYRLLELLGAGGMGQVFLAEHITMQRQVAIKILPRGRNADPSALERFQREARAAASLNHPNIVQAFDIDCRNDTHFIVMEFVPGCNAHQYVRQFGPLPWPNAVDFARQTALALAHVHPMGLVHRDVKPGNLLINLDGVIKLMDLGLARFQDADLNPLTVANQEVLGTADYLAPEQAIDSHNVDGRADIYSLGATLYFLLSGTAPFERLPFAMKLLAHQREQPTPIIELVPDLPAQVAQAIQWMMVKNPDQRMANVADAVELLTPYSAPLPRPFDRIELATATASTMAPAVGPDGSVVQPAPPSRNTPPGSPSAPPSRGGEQQDSMNRTLTPRQLRSMTIRAESDVTTIAPGYRGQLAVETPAAQVPAQPPSLTDPSKKRKKQPARPADALHQQRETIQNREHEDDDEEAYDPTKLLAAILGVLTFFLVILSALVIMNLSWR